mmetsp:Transcript_48562/g.126022  ORF Transcript_48562/g.126022 Transcript_48562/m.126022 type:complete len:342 (-) Transcript_48562:546-1571(-)
MPLCRSFVCLRIRTRTLLRDSAPPSRCRPSRLSRPSLHALPHSGLPHVHKRSKGQVRAARVDQVRETKWLPTLRGTTLLPRHTFCMYHMLFLLVSCRILSKFPSSTCSACLQSKLRGTTTPMLGIYPPSHPSLLGMLYLRGSMLPERIFGRIASTSKMTHQGSLFRLCSTARAQTPNIKKTSYAAALPHVSAMAELGRTDLRKACRMRRLRNLVRIATLTAGPLPLCHRFFSLWRGCSLLANCIEKPIHSWEGDLRGLSYTETPKRAEHSNIPPLLPCCTNTWLSADLEARLVLAQKQTQEHTGLSELCACGQRGLPFHSKRKLDPCLWSLRYHDHSSMLI